jgi:nitrogen fixation/metabolism regulation signal transduction histidine kinase
MDPMATIRLNQKPAKAVIFCLILLSALSLFALMFASDSPDEFNRLQTPLLMINTLSFLVLFVLVIVSGKKLVRDYKKSKLGAKLRLRMTLAFGGLSVVPAVVVFFFATNFMNKGIDVWFDAEVEQGLSNALTLGRSALDEQIQQGLFTTTNIALELTGTDQLDQKLNELRDSSLALELLVLNSELQVIGVSTKRLSNTNSRLPSQAEINQANNKQSWASLDSSIEGEYLIRILVPILGFSSNETPLYLQSLFSVDPNLSKMADSVEETYARYGRLTFLKIPLQYSYIFTLALVVLLALLLAIFGSIEFAERLVKPIESLEEGTRSITAGDAANQIPKAGDDEISLLVSSFMQAQKEAAWSDVARRMAHEINNPLTPIQLSAERIRNRYLSKLGKEDQVFLSNSTKTIIHQVEVLRDMVNAFGDFAKDPQLTFEHFDFNQLLMEAVDLFEEEKKSKHFTVSFNERSAFIEADIKRVLQILNNIFKNAIDATKKSLNPKIIITSKLLSDDQEGYLELKIKDNGHGFDPTFLKEAFQPYVTTKLKGTGLGLAIVKKLVQEHFGFVTAENNSEQGACLTILLPTKQRIKNKT